MRKVFLDLGTHHGQGLGEFIERFKMDSSWIIHTFEANPATYEIYMRDHHSRTPWVIAHNLAVSDNDGVIVLNQESISTGTDDGMGSTVVNIENWNPWNLREEGNFRKQQKVPCINLSNFIKNTFDKDDNIVIKMDIEGSEFVTLQKMIDDDTISYVKFLTVEWHAKFFTNVDDIHEKEAKLIEKLQSYPNLQLESWK